ncbi:MAG: antibiotic biosynthesis monooxygenase [Actinomycetota bacterium]|nr:antibiotic biosynthesis monooxygenase [Actinomycetota bacterium]
MPPPSRRSPMVVVSRRAVPGHAREFERWLGRLVDAAADAPGHVGSEIRRPGRAAPDDWVVVYQFADTTSLEAWMRSPARAELLASGRGLMVGDATEQVIAVHPTESDPVTAVSSVRVREGASDAYAAAHDRLVERMGAFDGFIRSELLWPVPGVQDDTIVLFTFDDRAHLDAWLASPERAEALDELAPLTESDRAVNVVGGFAGWFPAGATGAPPRWKQATLVLAALFPTSLAIGAVRERVLPDLATVPATLLANVIGIIVLTWLLMPWLTRVFAGWLRRDA